MARKTATEQITELRDKKIPQKRQHIDALRAAPNPLDEAEARHTQKLTHLAETGRAHLKRHALVDRWPGATVGLIPEMHAIDSNVGHPVQSHGLQAVLAAMFFDQLLKQGLAELRAAYDDYDGLTVPEADRAHLIAEAEAELFASEVLLEELIISTGDDSARPADINPAAVLGVEPGELLPWNFRSVKAKHLELEAEAARTAIASVRAELEAAQHLLGRLESDAAGYAPDGMPEALAADLEMARQDVKDLRTQLVTAQKTAARKNTIAARCNKYIADHIGVRPANQNTIAKHINRPAAKAANVKEQNYDGRIQQ
jgi:hypothetical protein